MLAYSGLFDQRTLALLVEHDAVVQRYRSLLALIDWQVLPDAAPDPSRPGKRPHPESAYIKALFIKINEGYEYGSQLRTFLLEHPLLVLELGCRALQNFDLPYGFDIGRTVPTERWVREKQRTLDHHPLQDLFHATVHARPRGNPRPRRSGGHRCEAPICLGPGEQFPRVDQRSLL